MAGGKARCAAAIDAVTLRCKWRRRGGRGREGGAFVHCDEFRVVTTLARRNNPEVQILVRILFPLSDAAVPLLRTTTPLPLSSLARSLSCTH